MEDVLKELAPPTVTQTIEAAPALSVEAESSGISWGRGVVVVVVVVVVAALVKKFYPCKKKE